MIEKLKEIEPAALVYLKSARCTGARGTTLLLEVESHFQRQGLEGGEIKALVERALSSLAGYRIGIEVKPAAESSVHGAASSAAPSSVPSSAPPRAAQTALSPDWVDREPLVKAALDIFKARFIKVKPPQAAG
jgi:hypothetical protein